MIIGIHGLKRSGKDTVGKMISEYMGESRVRLDSFAAPVRQFAKDTFGITEENRTKPVLGMSYKGKKGEEVPLTGRAILQLVGTEVCRAIHPDYWVNSLVFRNGLLADNMATKQKQGWKYLVLTDVRFVNEAEFIRTNGGILIFVTRPYLDRSDQHQSEEGLPLRFADYCISNHSNLDTLRSSVNSVCGSIGAWT